MGEPQLPVKGPFQLKKLSPKHRQIAALLAQGIGRSEIGAICHVVPEYVTMLAKQELFVKYVREMTVFTDVRLQALFERAVDVTADLMRTGTEDTKLRAAQTVLKATGKDGSQEKTVSVHHFVVELPHKAATTQDWESKHSPKRLPVTLDQEE